MDMELFGFKRKRVSESSIEGVAFTFEERAELFEDLLEEDRSLFPLLDAPHEVLAAVGACLDAKHLAALSELCARTYWHLDEAFADAWTALLLRDHMPRSRAKRYRAYSAASGQAQRATHHSAGLVLAVVDLSRIEWDGLLVAAPSHLRYRFLQTMGALKTRWGRLAQSWEWLATRILRRTTYQQLERFVPGYRRPAEGAERGDGFDEVLHQAGLDRDLRQRHSECNHQDTMASIKRQLGLADAAPAAPEAKGKQAEPGDEEGADAGVEAADVLSAMAPTARDQRLQQAERAAAAAAAAAEAGAGAAAAGAAGEVPSRDVVERMSFSEQLDLALRISQASAADGGPGEEPSGAPAAAAAEPKQQQQQGKREPTDPAAEEASSVLLKLKTPGTSWSAGPAEPLEVVLRDFTAGAAVAIPEQLRRSLEQIVLRLTRADWLLLYEGIALEAQLRARTVAHHCRLAWLAAAPPPARQLVDLEAEMLQLPLFASDRARLAPRAPKASAGEAAEAQEQELQLRSFLRAWEEHEAWAASLEEHLGPLDLEVSRERSNNVQNRSHTPYATDLCRLAFRNFAICEGRLFFALALAVYALISRLLQGRGTDESLELLESLHSMARLYKVQDDALALQRSTLQEYRYYLLEPLRRACRRLGGGDAEGEEDAYTEACA